MGLNAAAYAAQLRQLLPQGKAWNLDAGSIIRKLLDAMGDELARVDSRAADFIRETDPRTTIELLAEWETMLGLPDPCVSPSQTIQQRRAAVVAKYTTIGGQSRAFFIALAGALGYDITITEFRPFRAGRSAAGDDLTNGPWIHAWRVNAPETSIFYFRAGASGAGEPLRRWGNEELECVISAKKPAHTIVLFAYS